MKRFLLLFFFFVVRVSFCQIPNINWEHCYGGSGLGDLPVALIEMNDFGYAIPGTSDGPDANQVFGNHGEEDFWVIKTDSSGAFISQHCYGGSRADVAACGTKTREGGFIVAGFTVSNDGDVIGQHMYYDSTQAAWINSTDAWVLKFDSNFVLQWAKTYGGKKYDTFLSCDTTTDGGYIFSGYTSSNDDDVTGHHDTTYFNGNYDGWIVKTDSSGTIQWQKCLGGSNADVLYEIITTNNGYVSVGSTNSNDYDISGNHGASDFWMLKTDINGNLLWSKCYGDTAYENLGFVKVCANGDILASGATSSDALPDYHGGYYDAYLIRTDSIGNLVWQNCYGGSDMDFFEEFVEFPDSTFLVIGSVSSSDGQVHGFHDSLTSANPDMWLCRIAYDGTLLGSKCLGSHYGEFGQYITPLANGQFILAGESYGVGGDVSHNFPPTGPARYWVLKTEFGQVTADFLTASQDICPGTCIDFTNQSLNATYYEWSFPGGSPATSVENNPTGICYASPGTYSVSLLARDGPSFNTTMLVDYIHVFPDFPAITIIQHGDSLFAAPGYVGYQWYYNTNIISGANEYFYIASQSGNYSVLITDSNGCSNSVEIPNVIASVSSDLFNESISGFCVFPNPANNLLNIQAKVNPKEILYLECYDRYGRKMFTRYANEINHSLDISFLSSGVYALRLYLKNSILNASFLKN